VRPERQGLAYNDFKEASRLPQNKEVMKQWKQDATAGEEDADDEEVAGRDASAASQQARAAASGGGGKRPKKPRKVYRTAAELLAADEAASAASGAAAAAAPAAGPILDMRGPAARLITTAEIASSAAAATEGEAGAGGGDSGGGGLGKELLHNVGVLADSAEVALHTTHRKLRAQQTAAAAAARETASLRSGLEAALAEAEAADAALAALMALTEAAKAGVARVQQLAAAIPHASAAGSYASLLLELADEAAALVREHRTIASAQGWESSVLPAILHGVLGPAAVTWTPVAVPVAGNPTPDPAPDYRDEASFHLDDASSSLLSAVRRWISLIHSTALAAPTPPGWEHDQQSGADVVGAAKRRAGRVVDVAHAAVEATLLARLRAYAAREWDPKHPLGGGALRVAVAELALCDPPVVSPAALDGLLEGTVLPRLAAAAEAWDPTTDAVPVHAWSAPWAFPHLLGGPGGPLEVRKTGIPCLCTTLTRYRVADASLARDTGPHRGGAGSMAPVRRYGCCHACAVGCLGDGWAYRVGTACVGWSAAASCHTAAGGSTAGEPPAW
jgi:tuftelin-interacting protein 11